MLGSFGRKVIMVILSKKVLNYDTLGWALKSLSDACFKAAEQQKNGEKVTACGMSDDDLDNLCEQIPFMLNPYMTAGQVKKEAHISESTLRRAIADGELESVGCSLLYLGQDAGNL